MVEVVPEVSDSLTFLFQYSDHAFYLKLSFGEYCLELIVTIWSAAVCTAYEFLLFLVCIFSVNSVLN